MGAAMGRTADPVSFFEQLAAEPYRYDFYAALRRIECLFTSRPRIGQALRPEDEAVRLGQEPSLAFAPATISALRMAEQGMRAPRLEVEFFGFLGPNGPLPLHLAEFARHRLRNEADPTLARFLDIFNHRFIALFYRAWAQAQPAVSLDRPRDDRFATYVGAHLGLGTAKTRDRDELPDHAKLYFAGLLARQARNVEGLTAILRGYFRVGVRIEEFVGHWMFLDSAERTRIGVANSSAILGRGAIAGQRVWDRQNKFRVWLGPLRLEQFESFLPGGQSLVRLVAWIRHYLHRELEWDVRLVLDAPEIPPLRLGKAGRLGWTSWLNASVSVKDGDRWIPARHPGRRNGVLTLDAERLVGKTEVGRALAAA